MDWPTRENDLEIARKILHKYTEDIHSLSIFESLGDPLNQYRLSDWVDDLSENFCKLYGEEQGEFITKKIISSLLIHDHSLH